MEKKDVPYIVYEGEVARAERHIKRLVAVIVILIALLFVSNVAWLRSWMQYDYDSGAVTVDSKDGGNANYIGEDGDIVNGKDSGAETPQN